MGTLRDPSYDREITNHFTESKETFRRRTVSHTRWRMPRRYIIALMIFALLVLQLWKELNTSFMLAHAVILQERSSVLYPTVANWTENELDNFFTATYVADIFTPLPAAILIFMFSGYKVIVLLVSLSAFLHILTPVCLQHHTYALLAVLLAQAAVAAPIEVAAISLWKDWAPPLERTKLILFSHYGHFLGLACTPLYPYLFDFLTTRSSYYIAGSCALVWSLFWYVVISDTPSNDPLILDGELLYLEDNIPSDIKETGNLKDVPWKSILFSKPVLVLCLIYVKIACSWIILAFSGTFFMLHLSDYGIAPHFFIGFVLSYVIFLPLSTFLLDYLTRKFQGHALHIRKYFICGAFVLHAIVMFGTFAESPVAKAVSFFVSYAILSISLPAFICLPLDLSPRYVSILAGLTYTCYMLGRVGIIYYLEATVSYFNVESVQRMYLFDGLITLLAAGAYGFWGSAEEQPWSLVKNTISRSNDYLSYPKPEDEDDIKLVTDNV